MDEISLYDDCVMLAYNKDVRENCLPFSCVVDDLDDFFLNDADLYAEELLGKTYCWITAEAPHRIVALFTLSNDSIKTKLMSFIKDWFRLEDNKTGCRFIVVDAYNEDKVLRYYEKNGFVPLYKTEEIEKQYYDIPQDEHLKTRLLYFDLKRK